MLNGNDQVSTEIASDGMGRKKIIAGKKSLKERWNPEHKERVCL